MRVLHLCYSDNNGGAAIGAHRLHSAMAFRGVESEMLVIHTGTGDKSVNSLIHRNNEGKYRLANKQSATIRELYGVEDLPIRTINLSGANAAEQINDHPAEIVQLHWIGNNTVPLPDLPLIEKPIVWKMPDMWPFCGGEHYIRHGDPERYKEGYDVTQPFLDEAVDVDRFIWEAKRQYYKDLPLTIVSPSRFLAQCAHESVLLKDYDCHVIPNPLPSAFLYGPAAPRGEQAALRREYGLPAHKLIVMFGAFSTKERRKGFHHIQEMAARYLLDVATPRELSFLVCGADRQGSEKLCGYDVFFQPQTDDTKEFRRAIRAADLMLFPSEMDSTAMVVQEALSQGVPSIVFDVGGLPEMVEHKENGFIARPYEAADLASGIEWWRQCENKDEVRTFAAKRARDMHDPAQTVESYLALYCHVLQRYGRGESFKTGVFHEAKTLEDRRKEPRRVFILDPSAVGLRDSSHHAEHVLAFASMFAATHIQPTLVVNENAGIQNPFGDTEKFFDYQIYDKIRAKDDTRDGERVSDERIAALDASSEKSFHIHDALSTLDQKYSFTQNDAIIFPTIDRFCIEGLLFYLFSNQNVSSPSFHVNIMFEKAEFLLGRYPLGQLMNAVKASGSLGDKLFLYAETNKMAEDLSARFDVDIRHLPPPSLYSDRQLQRTKSLMGDNGPITEHAVVTYGKSHAVRKESWSSDQFNKPHGKKVVASLGRGRRDKGWARLPAIIEAFNAVNEAPGAVFVVQKPRGMDKLGAEEKTMAAIANVIMLDEIISDAMLESVCEQADVFLLPYDPGVYHNRGSAFGWRAVALEKPLVVSGGTALAETLLDRDECESNSREESQTRTNRFFSLRRNAQLSGPFANGHIAESPVEFAAAICAILKNQGAYREGAQKMMQAYYRTSVRENPIKDELYKVNFHISSRSIVIGDPNNSTEPPELTDDRFILRVNLMENSAAQRVLGEAGEAPLNFSASRTDGALLPDSLPAFARKALDENRISEIWAPERLVIADGLVRNWPAGWLGVLKTY